MSRPTPALGQRLLVDQVLCAPAVEWTPSTLRLADGAGESPVLEVAVLRVIDLTESHSADFTLKRLRELQTAYDPGIEAAALNFDHAWGGPSHGWCESLEVRDEILWAKYLNLSHEAVEGIRARRYTRQSAEVTLKHPATGGWYFTGLALLGNERPAVWGLPPVLLHRPFYFLIQKENPMSEDTPPTPPPAPPTTTNEPSHPVDPPAPQITEAELVTLRQGASVATRLLGENAKLKAGHRLDALGKRVTPAIRKRAEPLLTALFALATPLTVKLTGTSGQLADADIAEAILGILGDVLPFDALGAGEIARDDPPPVDLAGDDSGLPPERAAELDRKFKFRQGYGYRNTASN